jgi:rfaE bifunctional protein kinase chain/domain
MLTDRGLEGILKRIPALTIGVVGDLFLDRYLDIDAARTEPSIETGLDAYQVTGVRCYAGAAGTVMNNLAALGVKQVQAIAVIGDDGEGYELRRALSELKVVDSQALLLDPKRRTPTYTKPMLRQAGQPARELNRLDIKNHVPLSAEAEAWVMRSLDEIWPRLDALLVLDQVGETGGVITESVIRHLGELGETLPQQLILADSRERISQFRSVFLKPNASECVRGMRSLRAGLETVEACAGELARRTGRPVFCTCGAEGIWLMDPRPESERALRIPAYPVEGPIDIVGAGDSTSAALACALGSGSSLEEAAAFGNLVASITIQQLGTTGTATPAQVQCRWQEATGR